MFIQIGLGTFFAHKLRSAVLYERSQHQNDADSGDAAIEHYQKARDAWAAMAERAKNVYRANVSYGSIPKRSGHWLDRLRGIDADLAAMKAKVQQKRTETASARMSAQMADASTGQQSVRMTGGSHTPPEKFEPGKPLGLRLVISGGEASERVRSVRLRYRHVDQAERWNTRDAR